MLNVDWWYFLLQCKGNAIILGKPINLAIINLYNFGLRHDIIHSKAAFSLKPNPALLPASVGMNCQLDNVIFSDCLQSIKSKACGDGVKHSWSVLSVLSSLLGMDLKRRIQEQMNWEVPVAESTKKFEGQGPGKPVMCRMLDRDKPVVALYFRSGHPPPFTCYTSLIATHLASVGQEMGQCFGGFVTWYSHLLLMEWSIFDNRSMWSSSFQRYVCSSEQGPQFGGKGHHLRVSKLCGKQAELKFIWR